MKKLLFLSLLLIGLAAVLVYRAFGQFPDLQVYGAPAVPTISMDAQAAASRLAAALQIPTISHDDPGRFDRQAFIDFHRYLEKTYPLVHAHAQRLIINDYSLVYRFEGQRSDLDPVLLMGHMDVVPVDPASASQWAHPPFAGIIDNGVIWGRGAMDNKVTVLALMESMEMMLANGQLPARRVYFSFGHDEEIGGQQGARQVASFFQQQGIRFEFVLDEGGAIVEGMVPGVSSPVAMIGIAEKGYVNLHLTVDAPGGHSSQPPAQTAAGILARAIVAVENHPFPSDLSAMTPNFQYLGHYMPLAVRIALANTWLFSPIIERALLATPATAASIRTSTAVTMLEGSSKSNILPTRATAVANFRILPGDSIDGVKQYIELVIDDPRVSVTAHMASEPVPMSSTQTFGFRLLEKLIRGMDEKVLVSPYVLQGGTDAKHFVGLSDSVYRFLMIRADSETMKRIHGVNEQISVDDYGQAVRFYSALLGNLDDQPAP